MVMGTTDLGLMTTEPAAASERAAAPSAPRCMAAWRHRVSPLPGSRNSGAKRLRVAIYDADQDL